MGIGKGTISRALGERALKREPRARVIQVECPDHGGPFRLWNAVLRGLFDLDAGATDEVMETTLAAGIVDYLPGEAEQVAVGERSHFCRAESRPRVLSDQFSLSEKVAWSNPNIKESENTEK